MPSPAFAGLRYANTSSIAEDVTDIIYQITPEDTPFMNMIGRGSASNVFHQWQLRSINTRQDDAKLEGFLYTFTNANQLPTRMANFNQIFSEEVRVSNTHQAVQHYAIDSLFADQMEVEMVGLKTNIEHALIQGTLASGNTGVPTRLGGIIQLITSGITTFTDFSGAVTLSETNYNDMVQVAWESGGEPRDVLARARLKRRISSFTGGSQKFIPADEQRAVNTIGFYESDFMTQQIQLSRDIPAQGIHAGYSGEGLLMVDRTACKTAFLRPIIAKRTPDIADSNDGVIVGELTLEVGNPLMHVFTHRVVSGL